MMPDYPTFGICGFSGSGKTTLILALIEQLKRRGLKICVVKHDVHGLNFDRPGKDSDRFYTAGADVIVRGPGQSVLRAHREGDMPLAELVRHIGPYYDLVLVEGHKDTPLKQKVWLCSDAGEDPPSGATAVRRVLRRAEERLAIVMEMIDDWLLEAWRAAPVYAGILIGGNSTRFGRPKHLEEHGGKTWLEQTLEKVRPHVDGIAVLGSGRIPDGLGPLTVLCDAPQRKGPLAGMLAAMRWSPLTSWIFLPCDLPLLTGAAVQWLLTHRKPGSWAVLPQLADVVAPEPLLAYYDLRSAPLLERSRRPIDLAGQDRVVSPGVPQHLRQSWTNVNTIDELAATRS